MRRVVPRYMSQLTIYGISQADPGCNMCLHYYVYFALYIPGGYTAAMVLLPLSVMALVLARSCRYQSTWKVTWSERATLMELRVEQGRLKLHRHGL
jgi:hypothetical protein